MKTFRKSTLISSVALLLVAIVALSGATFAWFSSKGAATATGIQATTTQSSNLVISKEMTSGWTQDLAMGVNKNLVPVTTDDLSAWYTASAKSFNDQKAADGVYTDASVNDYIKETIYVMYEAESGSQNVKATLTATAADGTTTNFYRVALQPITADGLSNNTVTDPIYYSVTAPNHSDEAQYGAYKDQVTTNNVIDLGTLNAKGVYGYNVYVWFEGEDLDCDDSHSANDVTLQIAFEGAATN